MFICISMLNMLKISGLEMYYCRLNRHYNMSLVNKIIKNDSNEKNIDHYYRQYRPKKTLTGIEAKPTK